MYKEQVYFKDKKFYICGDFNGRVGSLDFIPGIETSTERNVVDYRVNKEGNRLCDFLIDSCILNGRNTLKNDLYL